LHAGRPNWMAYRRKLSTGAICLLNLSYC